MKRTDGSLWVALWVLLIGTLVFGGTGGLGIFLILAPFVVLFWADSQV